MISSLVGRIIDQYADCLRVRIVQAQTQVPEDSDATADSAPPIDLGRMGLGVITDRLTSRIGRRFGGEEITPGDGGCAFSRAITALHLQGDGLRCATAGTRFRCWNPRRRRTSVR